MTEKPTQRPRGKRMGPGSIPLRLQERDREILKAAYEYRFLTTKQIQLLVLGSDQVILRRLQKLFHSGYLDRVKAPMYEQFVYALGNRGADELVLHSGIDRKKIDWTTKNREVGDPHVDHTLVISKFRIALTLALRKRPGAGILAWTPEGELKDEVVIEEYGEKPVKTAIVPDAYFTLTDRGDELHFFLEADRSTMTNERYLKKMKAYWHYWRRKNWEKRIGNAKVGFRVLTITLNDLRKENLREVTKEADDHKTGSLMFWFTSEKNYSLGDPESVLGPIWQTPKNDTFHHLLEE